MDVEFWDGKRGPGVEDRISPDAYKSVLDVMESAFEHHADKNAFTALGQTITYSELNQASENFAAYIQNFTTLKPGDRIALQMPSVLQYAVALYGALRAGLIIVNTNPLYTAREMLHQFNDAGVRALVYLDMYGQAVEQVLKQTSIEYLFESSIGDMLGFPKRLLVNAAAKHLKKMVPKYSLPKANNLLDCLKQGASADYSKPEVTEEDLVLLQYTGGTTGVAKGAMIQHKNLLSQVRQLKARELQQDSKGQVTGSPGHEILICPLPLYHIYAFTVHCVAALESGNHSILITDPRNMKAFIKAMKRWDFTALVGINTLFVGLMEHPEFSALNFSNLKTTASGGAALNTDTAKRWLDITGCHISEGYGLTETSPTVCTNPIDGQGKAGTVGLPVTGTALKVINDQGEELGFDEPGELCVKGPQVMAGYWQRPEATAEALEDGWLKTGDIAEIDEDGYVSIVDRKKDMILVSGFNVFPNEIEDVISSHPKVEMCACVGVSCEKSGEVPKVFVVKRDATLSQEELKAFCKTNLTGYKQPRHIEFREALPMSTVGKILRKDLKESA